MKVCVDPSQLIFTFHFHGIFWLFYCEPNEPLTIFKNGVSSCKTTNDIVGQRHMDEGTSIRQYHLDKDTSIRRRRSI